eukprot:TRINITY_DN23544_c0_g1_i1.p1 TRINITY_DN23544_c0_g1~~TRINITY_DN23544_c0_g1_i1.p1  ORF type:complete len:456 (+),score=52.52 TRINITY_DN23544_c0_g1_i1:282-1649(+)
MQTHPCHTRKSQTGNTRALCVCERDDEALTTSMTLQSCQRRECVLALEPRQEWVNVYFVPAEEIRTTWMSSALLCVWGALLLSTIQLCRWQAAWQVYDPQSLSMLRSRDIKGRRPAQTRQPTEADPVALILAVPVTYGICAVHALRVLTMSKDDAWSAEAMMDAAELFTSLALYAFQGLLVLYVDQGLRPGLHIGNSIVVDVAAVEGEALELRRRLQKLVEVGIMQYIFLTFTFNTIEVSAKAWDYWYPTSCTTALSRVAATWFPRHNISISEAEDWSLRRQHSIHGSAACADVWNAISLLLVVAEWFTCCIALFAIWTYEQSFADFLHPMKPFWKFWGVKGLLSVQWLQTSLLMIVGFLAEGGRMSDETFRTFLNYYMTGVEALLLAALNLFAYPPIPMPWAPCSNESQSYMASPGVFGAGLEELDPEPLPPQISASKQHDMSPAMIGTDHEML